MLHTLWQRWLKRRGTATSACRRRIRPRLECLEARDAPAAGVLDARFGVGGVAVTQFESTSEARAVATQADGKIVAAGYQIPAGGGYQLTVVRYNRDGSLDSTFSGVGKVVLSGEFASAVAVQSNGKIVVAGTSGGSFAIYRLNSNGALDSTFAGDGSLIIPIGKYASSRSLLLQPDGKIIVAGNSTHMSLSGAYFESFTVCRINANGTLDASFGVIGKSYVSATNGEYLQGAALTPGGKIVLVGHALLGSVFVCQLTAQGTLDASFGVGGTLANFTFSAFNQSVSSENSRGVAVQANGRIVMVGSADDDVAVARLMPNGSFDPSFDQDGRRIIAISQTGSRKDEATAVRLQGDGKIIIGGYSDVRSVLFPPVNHSDMLVLRLLASGASDPTFAGGGFRLYDLGFSTHDIAHALALNADGIIVAGSKNSNLAVLRIHRDNWIVAAQDRNGKPTVKILTPTGTQLFQFNAAAPTFKGGIRVAMKDINQDGWPEIFTAQGPGGAGIVRIWDGYTRQLFRQITVMPRFFGGLNIAVGDVIGEGEARDDLLVAADAGGAPNVLVFDPLTGALLKTIRVYTASFRGGVRLAVGHFDLSGDLHEDLYVAPGPGIKTVAKVFDVTTGKLLRAVTVLGGGAAGAYIAAGDIRGTGFDDLIVGAGHGAPLVQVFNLTNGTLFNQYAAFPPARTGGVRVAAIKVDSGPVKIVAANGPGAAQIRLVNGPSGTLVGQFDPFGKNATTGVFVAAGVR